MFCAGVWTAHVPSLGDGVVFVGVCFIGVRSRDVPGSFGVVEKVDSRDSILSMSSFACWIFA